MRLYTRRTAQLSLDAYRDTHMYVVQRLRYDPFSYAFTYELAPKLQIRAMNNWAFSPTIQKQAIERLRQSQPSSKMEIYPVEVRLGECIGDVYVLAAPATSDLTIEVLRDWVNRGCNTIEETDFVAAFQAQHQTRHVERVQTNAWWSYTEGFIWTVDYAVAVQSAHALRSLHQ